MYKKNAKEVEMFHKTGKVKYAKRKRQTLKKLKRFMLGGKNNNNDTYNNIGYEFMDTITIPKGSFIFFCSEGYRTIKKGELPPQKYCWAQLYPPTYEPKPKDSWFCSTDEKSMKTNTFYVYKLTRSIKMLVDMDGFQKLTSNLIIANETLDGKITKQHQANDYVEIGFMHKIFNIDGVFAGYGTSEVILFGPYEDKLEFVKMYGGEEAKTTWTNANEQNRYFTPSNNLVTQIKTALPKLSYYNKLRPYII